MERTKREEGRITRREAETRLLRYGWCRGVTHFWERSGPIEVVGRAYQVTLRCIHCQMERKSKMAPNGTLIGNAHTYKAPADYATPGFRAQRADLRRMLFVQGREIVPGNRRNQNGGGE